MDRERPLTEGRGTESRARFLGDKRVNVHSQVGRLNVAVGWVGLFLGLAAALWIGTWAFDGPMPAPAGFESYDALPRRLLRLGHIAAVMVGVINIVFGREIPRLALGERAKRLCSLLAAIAWPGLALGCAGAAFVPALKYALPAGALSLTAAAGIAAAGAVRALTAGGARRACADPADIG